MSEQRCLEAVKSRRIMSTNIFDLRRAEKAGFVLCKPIAGTHHWSLTPAGEDRLDEFTQAEE
jgi:hypothetical protein